MSIARLMLGTANFGLDDYPPGKGHKRVPRDRAVAIIRRAYEAGVRAFDTALAYGDGCAEDVLVKALGRRSAHVTTKLPVGYQPGILPRGWICLQHNPKADEIDPTFDGASVYTRREALSSLCRHRHLQVPYWLMDTSCRDVLLSRVGVTIYARQPYGRGQVPCQAALWFALNSQADYIVVGARTIAQLDDTLRWAESTPPNPLLPSVCTRR